MDFEVGSPDCGKNSNRIIHAQNRKLYRWRGITRWNVLLYKA